MKTKAQLSTAVLQNNRYIGAGEDPSSADALLVEGAYDVKLAEWRRRGFVWWTNTSRSTSEIPDEVFATISDLLSNEVQENFGNARPIAEKRLVEEALLMSLRRLNNKQASGESTPFSAY